MTKLSTDTAHSRTLPAPSIDPAGPDARRDTARCDLYVDGHQMHYKHQGAAVRSRSRPVREETLEGSEAVLLLADGDTLRWRHHDPDRLAEILELFSGRCVAYPDFHALRVGPYWFNCAADDGPWQDCRTSASIPRT